MASELIGFPAPTRFSQKTFFCNRLPSSCMGRVPPTEGWLLLPRAALSACLCGPHLGFTDIGVCMIGRVSSTALSWRRAFRDPRGNLLAAIYSLCIWNSAPLFFFNIKQTSGSILFFKRSPGQQRRYSLLHCNNYGLNFFLMRGAFSATADNTDHPDAGSCFTKFNLNSAMLSVNNLASLAARKSFWYWSPCGSSTGSGAGQVCKLGHKSGFNLVCTPWHGPWINGKHAFYANWSRFNITREHRDGGGGGQIWASQNYQYWANLIPSETTFNWFKYKNLKLN